MASVDLHVHTSASDGFFAPREVIYKAKKSGLSAIAITDHDTTDGLSEALASLTAEDRFTIIPGVELSTDYENQDIHILGYYMNYKEEGFQNVLADFREKRSKRALEIVEKLNSLGYEINYEEILKIAKNSAVGRPHIASALVSMGYTKNNSEAFDKLLKRGKPAYVPKHKISPTEAVRFIRYFRGIPVIAHPGLAGKDHIIPVLVKAGLLGIEVYHSDHKLQDVLKYLNLAKRYGMLITGGSDFHGIEPTRKRVMGVPELEMNTVIEMKNIKEKLENAIC